MMDAPEQVARRFAYSVGAYDGSAEEVGHEDGQPIVETFVQLAELIAEAIRFDRGVRS